MVMGGANAVVVQGKGQKLDACDDRERERDAAGESKVKLRNR